MTTLNNVFIQLQSFFYTYKFNFPFTFRWFRKTISNKQNQSPKIKFSMDQVKVEGIIITKTSKKKKRGEVFIARPLCQEHILQHCSPQLQS